MTIALRDIANDTATAETVKRDLSALQQGMKDLQATALDKAKELQATAYNKANAQIQERPIQALLIAFGVGFIASRLLRSSPAPAPRSGRH